MVGRKGPVWFLHLTRVCRHGHLFAKQVEVGQEWVFGRWGPAHQRQWVLFGHLVVWCANDWHLEHWVERPRGSLHSTRRVDKKVKSLLRLAVFWARALISEITTEDTVLTFLWSGVVSYRGLKAMIVPVLKV